MCRAPASSSLGGAVGGLDLGTCSLPVSVTPEAPHLSGTWEREYSFKTFTLCVEIIFVNNVNQCFNLISDPEFVVKLVKIS